MPDPLRTGSRRRLTEDEAMRSSKTAGRLEASEHYCGRLLVGLGDDTYDLVCVRDRGHEGVCRPACDLCDGEGEVRHHGGDSTWIKCPDCCGAGWTGSGVQTLEDFEPIPYTDEGSPFDLEAENEDLRQRLRGAVEERDELRSLLTEAVRQDYGTPGWRARAIKAGCLLDGEKTTP